MEALSSRGKRLTILHCESKAGFKDACLLLSAKNIKDSRLNYHQVLLLTFLKLVLEQASIQVTTSFSYYYE